MEERLQKLLSAAGVCSRRAAEEYITAGRVKKVWNARLHARAKYYRNIIIHSK